MLQNFGPHMEQKCEEAYREHLQRVSAVRTGLQESGLLLEVDGAGDLLLEQWALQKRVQMCERVYGHVLEVRVADAGEGT